MEAMDEQIDNAKSLVQRSKQQLDGVSTRAVESIDQATTKLGGGVEQVGTAIESAGKSTGKSMRRAGKYLQQSDPATMKEDFIDTVRRHPGATFAVGIGMGILLTRALSRGRS